MKTVIKKIAVMTLMLALVLCLCGCDSSDYKEAVSLMESGDYAAAELIFVELGDYKDSADLALECRYAQALELFDDGKYAEAMEMFEELDSYKDCKSMVKECETAILEAQYNDALKLMSEGKYADAGRIFKSMNYKDSNVKYNECRAASPYELTEIGDMITFGRYEQDNDISNGNEPIDWRVLDKEDGKVLVISDKALEMLPYFAIYWKRSHIGGWLNGPFLNDFTLEEKAMIVETTVTADKHPDKPETDQGSNTEHGMYLLSVDEVLKYLPTDEDRTCYATEYLKYQFENTIHLDGLEENGTCDWWLRTALSNYSSGASIAIIGGGGNLGWATHNCRLALRPVCWIQLEPAA